MSACNLSTYSNTIALILYLPLLLHCVVIFGVCHHLPAYTISYLVIELGLIDLEVGLLVMVVFWA